MVPALPAREDEHVQRLAISTAAAANKGGAMLMGTAMAVYIGREGSPLAVSLVAAVFFFGQMVFSPVWGAIADVTGNRRAVLIGTAFLATLSILPLLALDGVWAPLGFRGLYAVFAAGFLPVMLTIVAERGGADSRGRSIGFFSSAQAVGFTMGQFFAGVLLGLLVPWSLYLMVAAVSAVVVLSAVVIDDPTPPVTTEFSRAAVAAEVRNRLLPKVGDRAHLRTNGLQWLYVAILLRNMTVIGTGSLMPIYLVSEVGTSEFLMGVLLAINPAAQMAFMYGTGWLTDRFGRRPLVILGMASSGVYGIVMAAAVLPGTIPMRAVIAAVGFLVLAAGFSALTTGATAFISDVAPTDRESELIGLRYTARGLGGVVGPPLFGLAAGMWSFEGTFAAGSSLAVVGTVLVWFRLVESHGATAPESGATAGGDG